MKEHLFAALEFDGKSRVAEGVAVRYNDRAARQLPGGNYSIAVRPGALTIDDAILNVGHDRGRPLARTGGGGLTFQDSPEALTVRAELPDTAEGRDAATLLERRVLRGFSLELDASADAIDDETRTLTIEKATVTGVALVDRPAFPQSEATLRRFAFGDGEWGGYYDYGSDETISDRDTVKKQRIQAGAFKHSLNDKAREIGIQIGDDPGKILGSKLAGTVQFKDDDKRLAFTLPKGLPDTTYANDLKAQLDAGLILGVAPLFRIPPADKVPKATEQIPEPGNPDTMIEVVSEAVLFGIAVRARPRAGSSSGVNEGGGKFWDSFLELPVY